MWSLIALVGVLVVIYVVQNYTVPVLGVVNGRLADCSWRPNCVSSYSSPEDKVHFIAPIVLPRPVDHLDELVEKIVRMKGSRVVKQEAKYVRFAFVSKVFRFIDDVELQLLDDGTTLHVRSASRVGYGDLGVNRKRVEAIRRRITS